MADLIRGISRLWSCLRLHPVSLWADSLAIVRMWWILERHHQMMPLSPQGLRLCLSLVHAMTSLLLQLHSFSLYAKVEQALFQDRISYHLNLDKSVKFLNPVLPRTARP